MSGFSSAKRRGLADSRNCGGLSLIELLVALAISTVLIFGATEVYVRSRAAYGVNESTSRLQETARYALSVVEPDIRMANYWGLLNSVIAVEGGAAQTTTVAPVANGAPANVCGNNFAVDIGTPVQGDNNNFFLSATRQTGCDSLTTPVGGQWGDTPVVTADTITVRRASTSGAAGGVVPTAGRLQICSLRDKGLLFSNGVLPALCALAAGQISDIMVNAYYVDQNSGQNDAVKVIGTPSLRRKTLTSNGTILFQDQEVIPGIEDMQVQFGIDPNYGADPYGTSPNAGNVTRYVNADAAQAALAAGAQIVAVRIWLLVRSESPEVGFEDTRTYEYGDRLLANGAATAGLSAGRAFQPSLSADNGPTSIKRYRRLLVSRTLQLRNAIIGS